MLVTSASSTLDFRGRWADSKSHMPFLVAVALLSGSKLPTHLQIWESYIHEVMKNHMYRFGRCLPRAAALCHNVHCLELLGWQVLVHYTNTYLVAYRKNNIGPTLGYLEPQSSPTAKVAQPDSGSTWERQQILCLSKCLCIFLYVSRCIHIYIYIHIHIYIDISLPTYTCKCVHMYTHIHIGGKCPCLRKILMSIPAVYMQFWQEPGKLPLHSLHS